MTDPQRRLAPIVRIAPAKLNLTLAVVGRRTDGYHALHSVMVPLGLADRLSVALRPAGADTLHVAGFDAGPPDGNLVLRAIAAARDAVVRPGVSAPALAARLEKRIPVAAGLAGGSSDAAAAMDAALEAWDADVDADRRRALAASLGSDVPFFLAGAPALVEGRGDRVTPLRPPIGEPVGLLLVTPAVAVSTPAAFATYDAGGPGAPASSGSTRLTSEHLAGELRAGLRSADLVARAGVLASANDLANAAAVLVPGLVPFRRRLLRLLGRPVGLSGSGATLWALYPSLDEARTAADLVAAAASEGGLPVLGDVPPFVTATTITTASADDDTTRRMER